MEVKMEWREVKGFPDYRISKEGEVLSLHYKKPKRLKQTKCSNGYMMVCLAEKNKRKQIKVHVLMLEVFKGPRPEGYHGCHNDGDKTNNKLLNLRWDTPKNNAKDKIKHGTQNKGEKQHSSVFTEREVLNIRQRIRNGEHCYSLSKEMGVNNTTIYAIRDRKTWKHLKEVV
jgi:hypothetical protein